MLRLKTTLLLLLAFLGVATTLHADDYQLRRRYDVLFHEAMYQRQRWNDAAAFDLLQRCAELRPDAAEVWFFLSPYYEKLKQPDKAFQAMERASQLDPDNTFYMESLASNYFSTGEYEKAAELTEKIYDKHKDRQELLETLFDLYTQLEEYPKAVETLQKIETIDGVTPQTSLRKLKVLWSMDQKTEALKEAKQLALRHPEETTFATIYSDLLLMADSVEQAHKVLTKVLNENPNHTGAQLSLFNYYIAQNDTLAADSVELACLLNPKTDIENRIKLLRRRIAINNANGGDSTQILQLFHRLEAQPEPDIQTLALHAAYMDLIKMPQDSIVDVLQQILEIQPDDATARLELVQYAWKDENYTRAVELCQQARQYNPEEMVFYYYQGIAYNILDDSDHALEAFENGISVINDDTDPKVVGEFYAALGDLLHDKGREQEAFEAYDKCLEVMPDNVGCLNNYAYFLALKGERLEQAEKMSHKTITAEPNNGIYLDTYAWILFVEKRYSEANIYIEQALKNYKEPDRALWEHVGDIACALGNIDRAVECWTKALEKEPDNKTLKKKIKKRKLLK